MELKELLKIKKDVEDAKTKVSQTEGQLIALKKQLKDEFDCDSLEALDELIENYKRNLDRLSNQLQKGEKELSEKYDLL